MSTTQLNTDLDRAVERRRRPVLTAERPLSRV